MLAEQAGAPQLAASSLKAALDRDWDDPAARSDALAEESGMGLAWVTQAAARGFATSASPVSYVLDLKLRDPAGERGVVGWATALDARQSLAVARVLGGTPQQVSAGLSAAQVLPALPGSLVGVPLGIGLFAVTNGAGRVSVPPGSWLVAVVLGTLAAVAYAHRHRKPRRTASRGRDPARTIAIGLDLFRDWYRPQGFRYQHGFSTRSGNDGK